MSLLAAHLDARVVPGIPDEIGGPTCTIPAVTTLADLAVGEQAVIGGFDPTVAPTTARRLFDLGFAVGSSVRVVRRAPLRDPIVFSVAHYEIALRRAEASAIRVRQTA